MDSITITKSKFPDNIFYNYVKNTLAKGSSTLTKEMLKNAFTFDSLSQEYYLSMRSLGIKDITGIDYLLEMMFSNNVNFLIDISYNHIIYYDWSNAKSIFRSKYGGDYVPVETTEQCTVVPANEIQQINGDNYPYQFSIKKYIPLSAVKSYSVQGSKVTGMLFYNNSANVQYIDDKGLFKTTIRPRIYSIFYYGTLSKENNGDRICFIIDPAIYLKDSEAKQTISKNVPFTFQLKLWTDFLRSVSPNSSSSCPLDMTLPVTWSISEGELPPGLSLNPSTGLISGTPT